LRRAIIAGEQANNGRVVALEAKEEFPSCGRAGDLGGEGAGV